MIPAWMRRWWPFGRPVPVPSAKTPTAVLNLPVHPPHQKTRPVGRVLVFRHAKWTQDGAETAKGTVRFVREIAVDGRAVEMELEVCVDDLDPQPDGTLRLRGR